jgi:acyl-CoA reductase-like NAD-dependent aldehyde dehydrogenase
MIRLPVLRWGEPYQSMDVERIVHFESGEPIAEIGQANSGLVERDLRHVVRARQSLRSLSLADLLGILKTAAHLYLEGDVSLGGVKQSAADFVRFQSATTGLPETLCRLNMAKNHFVLTQMDRILESLTRGLDLDILSRGHGMESRGVPVSYQTQAAALGLVLPSNSPGVHTLWLPVLPLQIGLVLKPGAQEPWTPYRLVQALFEAGIPRAAVSLYPGPHDVGGTIISRCDRSLIFGGQATVDKYRTDPRVQVHGPGFSKILLGEDKVDQWPRFIDMMVESVLSNGGRSCINCSSIWTPRHADAIADALAEKLGPIEPLPADHPQAILAAFTSIAQAEAMSGEIDKDLSASGVRDVTARFGQRLAKRERHAYLRPTVIATDSPEPDVCRREYLFPFVAVVHCPQQTMLERIGPTLVCTAITHDAKFQQSLLDARQIDRLNFGAIPTTKLNWLQPHEGNIVEFLFRPRAFQQESLD